jgi:hypothetical protein
MASITRLFILLLLPGTLFAGRYEFTQPARDAYEKILSLRFGEAYALLAHQKMEDPNNLTINHIENYIDFFRIYISEEEDLYQQLRKNKKKRLQQLEAGDESSPYFLFTQADVRLQWALIELKFGDYFSAFSDVSKAYKLLRQNQARFPHFMPNLKDLGILHAMVGTIPDNYKWGATLLGLEGTIEQGEAEIRQVLDYARSHDFIFETETHVLYTYFLLHLKNDKEGAWQALKKGNLSPKKNPLHGFIIANVAMRIGKNEEAIQVLEQTPRSGAFLPFPYLDFMLGMTKLRRLDEDADVYFSRFLGQYRGRNFIKESYQKLAWHELIHGNPAGYQQYMKACIDHGNAEAGEDKNALREAIAGKQPLPALIRARLLFDGGYYEKAYHELQAIAPKGLDEYPNRLEYVYRMGRILHGLQRHDEAMVYYRQVINLGEEAPFFFACNAALQIGLIHESLHQYPSAQKAFKQCLHIYPDEYRTGLHQKAKAGLARLEEKK